MRGSASGHFIGHVNTPYLVRVWDPKRLKGHGRARMVGSLPELPEDVLNPILASAALGDFLGVLALAAAGRRARQSVWSLPPRKCIVEQRSRDRAMSP